MNSTYRVLILEEDLPLRQRLARLAQAAHWESEGAASLDEALVLLKHRPYDLLLAEVTQGAGESLLEAVLAQQSDLLVAALAAFAGFDHALKALETGAWDWMPKPFGDAQAQLLLAKARRALNLRHENKRLRAGQGYFEGLSSPASLWAQEFVIKVAPTDETVLLTGETGTGKSELALAIQARSRRHDKPFITVFCSALAEGLLESELFGHAKGAFTGAERDRQGKLVAAHGGTLFLDEVGELSLGAQARLLRFLNDRMVEPVGSNITQKVDARIIAATNRDLKAMVERGAFREDLFFRLNMLELKLMPLRERRDEIRVLTRRFLDQACARREQKPWTISTEAERALQAYPWPGNLRELKHAIDRAVILGVPPSLDLSELPAPVQACLSARALPLAGGQDLQALEKAAILAVLKEQKNLRLAAQALGISTVSLWRKRKRLGLDLT